MASAISSQSRIFLIMLLVTLSLFWFDALRSQEVAPLPDYVIKDFGKPPAVPEGPLSEELQSAVQMAFIDSITQSTWGRDQTIALDEIAESKDLRIVWLISDLMRFVTEPSFHAALANAASKLLGKKLKNENQWGVVIPAALRFESFRIPKSVAI